jgi:hypothetical protein
MITITIIIRHFSQLSIAFVRFLPIAEVIVDYKGYNVCFFNRG